MTASANILLPVAKVIKSFGVKGEMIIRYSPSFQGDLDEKRPVFIAYDGLPVPFFIESITGKGVDQALVKLSGINNEQMVKEITGELILIEQKGKRGAAKSQISDIIGFTVTDPKGVLIGTVSGFYDYPGNPCFGIKKSDGDEREILLPAHEDIIQKIDPRKKVLVAHIPEGLLDI